MRRMSVSMTLDAVRERRKTVTRRHVDTWQTLKAGDRLALIEKGMGLPKGAKQVVVAEVEILAVSVEDIGYAATPIECEREGLPHLTPPEFIAFWLESHGYSRDADWSTKCRRIVWRYLDPRSEPT